MGYSSELKQHISLQDTSRPVLVYHDLTGRRIEVAELGWTIGVEIKTCVFLNCLVLVSQIFFSKVVLLNCFWFCNCFRGFVPKGKQNKMRCNSVWSSWDIGNSKTGVTFVLGCQSHTAFPPELFQRPSWGHCQAPVPNIKHPVNGPKYKVSSSKPR